MSSEVAPRGDGPSLAVVFVHGLFSSGEAWDEMDRLLHSDETLRGVHSYRFEYDSPKIGRTPLRKAPSLDTVADGLDTYLRHTVTESDVALVTHSQGGLVAIRMIERSYLHPSELETRPTLRLLALYACPHAGSTLGWSLRRGLYRGHDQEKALRPLDERTAESIRRVSLAVTSKLSPVADLHVVAIAGESDGIVTPASARSTWQSVETVPGDHSEVIRPKASTDQQYAVLQNRLRLAGQPRLAKAPGASPADESFWLALATEVADRLHLNRWDASVGGLVRASYAIPSSVLEDLHDFCAWLLGRLYPPGHPELRRALDTLGGVLVDLLDTFNQHAETIHEDGSSPWVRVHKWYAGGGHYNPRYHEDLADYSAHVDLLTDLTLEATRAAEWFCELVREELDPTFRLADGALVLEAGPFSEGTTRYLRPTYSDQEKAIAPSPYGGLAAFRTRERFERDLHSVPSDDEHTAGAAIDDLDDLEQRLASEQLALLASEVDTYTTWRTRGDRDSLMAVLRQGSSTQLLSSRGLRAPIWETTLHLRFHVEEEGELHVSIEADDGVTRSDHSWTTDKASVELFRELDQAMTDLGEHLGPTLFLPTESIRTTADALAFAATYRAQKLNSGSERVALIIEFVDGWYITESGLFPRDHPHYFISSDRLDEMDWEEHIAAKGWDGIHRAMQVARALLSDSHSD